MDSESLKWLIEGLLAVLWWLLRQKDISQGKALDDQQNQINLLFKKHDTDVAELQALKLQIASQHYVKGELDTKFDRLESSFREGLRDLGDKFDSLSQALLSDRGKQ